MLVVVLVLANVLGGSDTDDDDAVADVSGGTSPQRAEDLPPLPVEVPAPTPEADATCPQLMQVLPLDLLGDPARLVDSDTPYAAAWGDPAVVLVCGVPQPEGLVPGEGLFTINGVTWYVDQTDPEATVWTAVDRAVYVEVSLPPDVDSAPVTALSDVLAAALPAR
ncbi:Protein of unknown function [Geodermatophilus dictyosporus]|uniref:DUF3515 domain-containing protein n=1 Tax=Geodermatophilus dictyosporus TaxID=1523247 RepID=A0A1I5KQV5_9ACTN|nr:Protein of unknown function [Geodermatophilus dictyosporus]